MNPLKVLKVLETVWLVVACASIILGAYAAARQNWKDMAFMLMLTAVAGLIYWRRRKQRMWLEKDQSKMN